MADKKKNLVELAEQLVGIADGGGAATTGSRLGIPSNLTEAVSGHVQEMLGISEGNSVSDAAPGSRTGDDLAADAQDMTSGAEKLAADLVRDSEAAVESTGDLIGWDIGKQAADISEEGEFSSKWDWRREATERAGD